MLPCAGTTQLATYRPYFYLLWNVRKMKHDPNGNKGEGGFSDGDVAALGGRCGSVFVNSMKWHRSYEPRTFSSVEKFLKNIYHILIHYLLVYTPSTFDRPEGTLDSLALGGMKRLRASWAVKESFEGCQLKGGGRHFQTATKAVISEYCTFARRPEVETHCKLKLCVQVRAFMRMTEDKKFQKSWL